jgi:hypothetical protein
MQRTDVPFAHAALITHKLQRQVTFENLKVTKPYFGKFERWSAEISEQWQQVRAAEVPY